MKRYQEPEMIGQIESIDEEGDPTTYGDRVVGLSVFRDAELHREGTVRIDVREIGDGLANLTIEVGLPELMAAIASATLHAEKR